MLHRFYNTDQHRAGHLNMRVLPLRRAVMMASLSMATLPALAQYEQSQMTATSENTPVMEEVVVTGMRRSIQNSMDVKMASSAIVEAVSAVEIGKLPDSSIADSLARLPGAAAQRLDGRSSSISLRGFGENFSATTFNGREQVSIGDNRGVEFDVYPSEIMSGVVVQKTADATLVAQGIAGVIDLQSVRPLAYGETAIKFQAAVEQNGIGQLNPDGDEQGHRATFAYIDQFAEDTVGIALVASTMASPNNEERWEAWGYPEVNSDDNDPNNDYAVLGGAKPFVRSSMLERDTWMGVLQYQPNDRLNIVADVLSIQFLDEKRLRGIEIPAEWGTGVINTTLNNGFVTEGTIDSAMVQIRNDFEQRDADLTAYGFNVQWDLNDQLRLQADVSHSAVDRQIWSLESYSGTGRGSDQGLTENLRFTQSAGEVVRFFPALDYSDADTVQLGGALSWGNGNTIATDAQDGFINTPQIDDALTTAKISAEYEFLDGPITAVHSGIYYSTREKSKQDSGFFLTLNNYPDTLAIPDAYRAGNVSLDFIGMGNMIAYDSFRLWRDGFYTETDEGLTVGARSTNDWQIDETITTAFVKSDWSFSLSDTITLTGDLGLQRVQTDQTSTGKATTMGVDANGNERVDIVDTQGGADFTSWLPSLNATLHLTDEQRLRFAAARTLSRSRMDRMNAGFSFGFDQSQNVMGGRPFTASGGNPQLKPNFANQFDVSYEYYFSDAGYVSAAGFFKDLRNWQLQETTDFDMADIINPSLLDATAQSTLGRSTFWANTEGGSVRGLELSLSLPGEVVSDYLQGMGVLASQTFLSSELTATDGAELDVPGLSNSVQNLTLYYERSGWQARTSWRKRSDFKGERSANSFAREQVEVLGSTIVDAQISYDFSDSSLLPLEGFSLAIQGQNLTDEPFVTLDPSGFIKDHQVFGRTFLLTAAYQL